MILVFGEEDVGVKKTRKNWLFWKKRKEKKKEITVGESFTLAPQIQFLTRSWKYIGKLWRFFLAKRVEWGYVGMNKVVFETCYLKKRTNK